MSRLRAIWSCSVVLAEPRAGRYGERPDAIGWQPDGHSVVIECKTSLKDYLDEWRRRKDFRTESDAGAGIERYYMARVGVLWNVEDFHGWGLIEVYPDGSSVMRSRSTRFTPNRVTELTLLLAALAAEHHTNKTIEEREQLTFRW